jgi:hypothetical protein
MHGFKNLAKICKYMHIQTETIDSLFNYSHRFLKSIWLELVRKTCFFIICTSLIKILFCMSDWHFIDSATGHDTDLRPVSLEPI